MTTPRTASAAAGINACESPILAVNRSVANDNPRQIDADSLWLRLPRVGGLEGGRGHTTMV